MSGTDLFETPADLLPADPSVRQGAEGARLSAQCLAMLQAFRADPCREQTNAQLAAIARKYTSRISDLRAAGHLIRLHFRDRNTGMTVYRYDGCSRVAADAGSSADHLVLRRRTVSAVRRLLAASRTLHDYAGGIAGVASALVQQLRAAGLTPDESRLVAVQLAGGAA